MAFVSSLMANHTLANSVVDLIAEAKASIRAEIVRDLRFVSSSPKYLKHVHGVIRP